MFASIVYATTVALLSLRSFVSASPLVTRASQGAWNPPITTPQAGDIWTVGSAQTVTWDTSEIPPSAANDTGILLLGYFDGQTERENLDINRPLAYGFPLVDGLVQFEVPDVQTRDTYIVVLMGNSGNASPEFTIINPSSTSAMVRGSSGSTDKVIAQKDPNDFDPTETESLTEGAPPPALCRERHPSSHRGSTPSPGHNSFPREDSNKHC